MNSQYYKGIISEAQKKLMVIDARIKALEHAKKVNGAELRAAEIALKSLESAMAGLENIKTYSLEDEVAMETSLDAMDIESIVKGAVKEVEMSTQAPTPEVKVEQKTEKGKKAT